MNIISRSNLLTTYRLRILLNSTIIFLLLVFNFALLPISGGESHYLSFAKQFMNPNWIPGSFSLTEFPGTRLIFQWMVGSAMLVLDFESTALFFRVINFILIAIPLAMIFEKLNLRTFEWMFMFQLFIMSGQSLFAKEWIFGTFEPKTISYALVMYAFYYWMSDRKLIMAIFLGLATYFHVLVGGWLFIVFIVCGVLKGEVKQQIRPAMLYAVLILPFFIYLSQGYFDNAAHDIQVDTDFAYVYYRLPHHLGLVKSWPFFFEYHFTGILLTLIGFIISLRMFPKLSGIKKDLTLIVIIAFSINLFFVLVAIIDSFFLERSGGLFLKYYPFRTNSFGLFLIYLLVIMFISSRKWFLKDSRWLSPLIIILTLVLTSTRVTYAREKQKEHISDTDFYELMAHIRENTDPGSVFMMLELPSQYFLPHSFSRLSNRENFVVNKFVPAEKNKLAQWYERELIIKKVRNNKLPLDSIASKYGISHVITKSELNPASATIQYKNDTYFLYKYQKP